MLIRPEVAQAGMNLAAPASACSGLQTARAESVRATDLDSAVADEADQGAAP